MNRDRWPRRLTLLHVGKQISLEDVFALFVLLRLFVRLLLTLCQVTGMIRYDWDDVAYVFPTEHSATFDAINVSNGVSTRGHGAISGFAFDNVDTCMLVQQVEHGEK